MNKDYQRLMAVRELQPRGGEFAFPCVLAFALLQLAASLASADSFAKPAWLLFPGDNTRMTVLCQLNNPGEASVRWGEDKSGVQATTVTQGDGNNIHAFQLSGLKPGAIYQYQIEAGKDVLKGSFRAAPPDNATAVKFIAYGDTRRSENNECARVSAAMLETLQADRDFQTMALHVGDWVSADNEKCWNQFLDKTEPAIAGLLSRLPMQGCIGNHEGSGSIYRRYYPYPYVQRHYWSFDYGPAHIAVLDQYHEFGQDSGQLRWLEADLKATRRPWKFLLFHEPGWSAGGHANSEPVRELIQPLAKKYGVNMVLTGHNHYYARAMVDGIPHITTGGGGVKLSIPLLPESKNIVKAEKAFEFCKIAIDGNALKFEAVAPDGRVVDALELNLKH